MTVAARGTLLSFFFQAAPDELALELREVVDEQLALEMIHLMLDANSQKSIRIHFKRLPVGPQGSHPDVGGALHLVEYVGYRQTTLFTGTASFGLQQFGVDEDHGLVTLLAHIEHDDAPMHVDLGGGEAHTLG